jgi:hypothetical protein
MSWVEQIVLRAPRGDEVVIESSLAAATSGLDAIDGLVAASAHRHASIHGDYLVLLVWDAPLPASGSPLGLHITASLARIGLVDHAVWPGQGE